MNQRFIKFSSQLVEPKQKQTRSLISIALCILIIGASMTVTDAEARVGGGRSFGNRGSRGFGTSMWKSRSTRSQPDATRSGQFGQRPANPAYPNQPSSAPFPNRGGSSFLRSLGAGMAGGFLGSMLFRGLGGQGMGAWGGGSGGIGFLEVLLLGALLFFVLRWIMQRSAMKSMTSPASNPNPHYHQSTEALGGSTPFDLRAEHPSSSEDGAAALMRQAKMQRDYATAESSHGLASQHSDDDELCRSTLDKDTASDLFFRIQASWTNRDLTPVTDILDADAQSFLSQNILSLKEKKQINRLENIAIRDVELIESWEEAQQEFATVRFVASVLDYTVSETNGDIIEGSKTSPTKFEEDWTFIKNKNSSQNSWKLAAISQI